MRSPWTLLTPLLLPASGLAAQGTDSVWVNTRSRVYHCPATEFYGKTTRGEYLREADAIAQGHRANGGRRCSSNVAVQGIATNPADEGPAAPPMPVSGLRPCTVERITDGDTFTCSDVGTIRPIGFDTPERGQEPFYTAAIAALASLMPVGRVVQLEYDQTPRDRHGRTLAYVWYEGQMINLLMTRQGWGVALPYSTTPRYAAFFARAEAAAQRERRGLWQVDGFACRPQDKRSRKCE